MTLGVRAAVRSPNEEFLLVRHTYTPSWHFPGGGVEVGQAAEVAQLHGIFFNNCVSMRDHVVVYLCDAEGELPIKSPSLEIAELGYFAPQCLPLDVNAGTERRIQEITFGKSISREW